MIFIYRCGHEGTEGFWRDDSWVRVNYFCPKCKSKITVSISKSKKLLLYRKSGGGNVKPSNVRSR